MKLRPYQCLILFFSIAITLKAQANSLSHQAQKAIQQQVEAIIVTQERIDAEKTACDKALASIPIDQEGKKEHCDKKHPQAVTQQGANNQNLQNLVSRLNKDILPQSHHKQPTSLKQLLKTAGISSKKANSAVSALKKAKNSSPDFFLKGEKFVRKTFQPIQFHHSNKKSRSQHSDSRYLPRQEASLGSSEQQETTNIKNADHSPNNIFKILSHRYQMRKMANGFITEE